MKQRRSPNHIPNSGEPLMVLNRKQAAFFFKPGCMGDCCTWFRSLIPNLTLSKDDFRSGDFPSRGTRPMVMYQCSFNRSSFYRHTDPKDVAL